MDAVTSYTRAVITCRIWNDAWTALKVVALPRRRSHQL
jgi:hypothetical protein